MAEFLLEVGCEEIPAGWLAGVEQQLSKELDKLLADLGLRPTFKASASTPRRLIACFDVAPRQDDREVSVFGPSMKQARDAAGRWTPAALGFAKKMGIAPEALEVGAKDPAKPEEQNLLFVHAVAGRAAAEVLPDVIGSALRALSFPKRMSWDAWLDDGKGAFPFGRPIRWMVALLDGEVVPFAIYEAVEGQKGPVVVQSGRSTWGHRFLRLEAGEAVAVNKPALIGVTTFDDLKNKLDQHCVVVHFEDRASALGEQMRQVVGEDWPVRCDGVLLSGSNWLAWRDLVEYPVVVRGTIAAEFQSLPPEVRTTVLVHHQKYQPLRWPDGTLGFAAVTNGFARASDDTGRNIGRGMARVVTARLRDARFFYDEDRKSPMEDAAKKLAGVTFFQGLGTYADKAARMERLVEAMHAHGLLDAADALSARRAARLAKADLTTLMVGEFPELQGVMGSLYLKEIGEDADVVKAVRWQYDADPVFPKLGLPTDKLPAEQQEQIARTKRIVTTIGIVDRFDTLAGHFSVGNVPSGSRDPYGLRRAGQEATNVVLWNWPDGSPQPSLRFLITEAVGGVRLLAKRAAADIVSDLEAFILERLRLALVARGVSGKNWTTEEVEAVLGARDPDPLDHPRECRVRLRALHDVRAQRPEDFAALAAAFKRINNILKQGGYSRPWDYEPAFTADAERALARALDGLRTANSAAGAINYEDRLARLAELRPAVDRFFDDVMVMVDDPKLRRARLGLLGDLVEPFYRVADISKLGGQG